MATSKLITPTNVTVQIPDFTDQPDQRVNSNCIDKAIDGINVFSSFINNGVSKTLTSGNLNDIKTPGRYYATSNVSNIPYAGASGYLDVYVYDSNRVAQTFRQFNDNKVYERRLISGTWESWTSLNDQMVNLFAFKEYQKTYSSIPAYGTKTETIDTSVAGYVPYGIRSYSCSEDHMILYECAVTSNRLYIKVKNYDSSAISNVSVTVRVAYIKSPATVTELT